MRSGIIVPLTLLGSAGASVVPYLRRSQPVCGQDELSDTHKELLESRIQTGTKPSYLGARADEVIDINVYQHVVAFNETLEGGYLSEDTMAAQFQLIQESFAPYNFNLKLAETRWVVNEDFASVNKGDDHENVVKQALRKGTYADLNLFYIAYLTVGIGNQGTGWSTWPWGSGDWAPNSTFQPTEFDKSIDGCFISSTTTPNGTNSWGFNQGKIAVHEAGHWLGLYHVFQGGCSGPGDYVNDTYPQGSDTFTIGGVCDNVGTGCLFGKDPPNYKNHMDYSDDQCRVEFTKGQEARMRSMFNEFRANTE
ncbi:hypothetical protein KVR01_003206 [Diaporthe batatas]|uniref:uncharacterized protein n=1 Tax=Diaporthe batatas TaxID=748121 RepID=UPI001D03757C|nr:uncharacterized protein KVR01_003206 [Diaporthe batatas]KAG8167517.1 hypothetical protein KVR01_003206 [Diaporthe batatas]